MAQRLIWIAGDWRQPDFAPALAWLDAYARCTHWTDVEEISTAVAESPTAIIIVQSVPRRVSRREVERWHAVAPLARLVALVGPWCEGELRSGRPWPGVVR